MATSIGQYTPVFLPGETRWQRSLAGHSLQGRKESDTTKAPCMHRCKTFFACGSSAPVRVEYEGGAAAWLAGTLVVPIVQNHKPPSWQELWPYRSLFSSLLQLVIRRPLWPVFLHHSTHSGTKRAPLPGVLLCCSACQAHRGAPPAGVLLCRSAHQSLKGAP